LFAYSYKPRCLRVTFLFLKHALLPRSFIPLTLRPHQVDLTTPTRATSYAYTYSIDSL